MGIGALGDAGVSIVISAKDEFSKEFAKVNKTLVATGAAITAFGVAGIAAFSKTIPGARDLAEETSKLKTVFDEINQTELEKTVKELGEAYILSDRQTTRLLASTGDLLTGLGFADDVALDFSKSVVELGSDLASFNNYQGGAAGAAEILEKALLGERDSLKQLGISILESDVKNQLLIDGTSELEGLALKQARANATLTLIMAQSGNAIGDTARTSEDLANRQRELTRQMENAADSIGTLLLPIALELTNVAISLIEHFGGLSDKQKKWIVIIGLAATALALILGPLLILLALLPAISAGIGVLTTATALFTATNFWWIAGILAAIAVIGTIIYAIKNWDKIVKKLGEMWNWFKNSVITPVFNFLKDKFEPQINAVKLIIEILKSAIGLLGEKFNWLKNSILTPVWNTFKDIYTWLKNKFLGVIGSVIDKIRSVISLAKKAGGSIASGAAKVLGSRQTGGYIPQTGLYNLHQGEYVVPKKDVDKGNSTVININNLNGFNARDIANQLQKELNKKI